MGYFPARNYYPKGPITDAEYQLIKDRAERYKKLLYRTIGLLIKFSPITKDKELNRYIKLFNAKQIQDAKPKGKGSGKVQGRRNSKGTG